MRRESGVTAGEGHEGLGHEREIEKKRKEKKRKKKKKTRKRKPDRCLGLSLGLQVTRGPATAPPRGLGGALCPPSLAGLWLASFSWVGVEVVCSAPMVVCFSLPSTRTPPSASRSGAGEGARGLLVRAKQSARPPLSGLLRGRGLGREGACRWWAGPVRVDGHMAALVCWGRLGWEELSFPSRRSVYLLLPLHPLPPILPHCSVPSRSLAASWLLPLPQLLAPRLPVTPVLQAHGWGRRGGGASSSPSLPSGEPPRLTPEPPPCPPLAENTT